ncbi:MAG: DUF1273 domain-containing protein [Ruminococcus sp.]|nr:DUF1273 domain-containing protein [Ruminococcus sp.]
MEGKTVCFSGHRPTKLPCHDEASPETNRLKSMLYKAIYDCIDAGYTNFVTGLAKGIDNWAADMIIEFKTKNENLRLICVKPYKNYGEDWKGYERWELFHIMEKADEVISVCDGYQKNCMRLRNEKMVDMSDKLIAVISEQRSGTGQTVRYAEKKGIEVQIINVGAMKDFLTEKPKVIK